MIFILTAYELTWQLVFFLNSFNFAKHKTWLEMGPEAFGINICFQQIYFIFRMNYIFYTFVKLFAVIAFNYQFCALFGFWIIYISRILNKFCMINRSSIHSVRQILDNVKIGNNVDRSHFVHQTNQALWLRYEPIRLV